MLLFIGSLWSAGVLACIGGGRGRPRSIIILEDVVKMEAGQGGEQDDDAAQHDDHADDLVDDFDAVGAEFRAHLVDEPRETPPPEECSTDDTHEPYHHLEGLVEL